MDFCQWWGKAKFVGNALFLTANVVQHYKITLSRRTAAQRIFESRRMAIPGLTTKPRDLGTLALFLALGLVASQSASALSLGDRHQHYLHELAMVHYRQGEEFGDNQTLTKAIEHYDQLEASNPRQSKALKLAQLQCDLDIALETPGQHQSSTEEMELAARANDALLALTSKPIPVTDTVSTGWHNALWDFAIALEALDIKAYNEAVLERIREHKPRVWARSQNNLGDALRTLVFRVTADGEKVERLRQAVEAYNNALLVWTQKHTPKEWASTQYALASTLRQLARGESGTEALEQAIEAYNNALAVWTLEQTPYAWAATYESLGNALWTLGQHEAGTENLELAVNAFRNALLVYTRENSASIQTQTNLGLAYWSLARKSQDPATLRKAMEAIRLALVYEKENHPDARNEDNSRSLERILTRGEALLPAFEEGAVSK